MGEKPKADEMLKRAGISKIPKNVKVAVALIAVLAIGFAAKTWWPSSQESFAIESSSESQQAQGESAQVSTQTIYVHVVGEVESPGVYELEEGQRAQAAVEAAGGFTSDADQSAINLAQCVTDGQQLVVPAKGEQSSASAASASSGSSNGLVNINTADATQLDELPGVGPSTAQKIIDYRESNGAFKTIDDICNVSGIGDSKFSQMKDLICV